MKTSNKGDPNPYPFRIVFIIRIYMQDRVLHIVCTSDGGLLQYMGRLPPMPEKWLIAHNLSQHVKQISPNVYLISGECVA